MQEAIQSFWNVSVLIVMVLGFIACIIALTLGFIKMVKYLWLDAKKSILEMKSNLREFK